ncbi:hypothetical protein DY218_27390 [Streptomyces triticagri]|uniref:Uncharacterized protein n=1 Tax=Streptomyces triticagri TaxID=2293568 RepID=A0A372LY84_9ACTN|nr:hypothetical protein [Streptomyces triticagri]RFU83634.1 hypothetical protein DY218_27390 [Streptomyces triticagri]
MTQDEFEEQIRTYTRLIRDLVEDGYTAEAHGLRDRMWREVLQYYSAEGHICAQLALDLPVLAGPAKAPGSAQRHPADH